MNFSQQSISPSGGQGAHKLLSFASPRRRLTAAGVFLALAGGGAFLWVVGHYKITLYPFACGFKQRYGLPCPTCGFTTSAIAFAQGRIIDSFYTQPAAAVFCCIAVVIAIFALLQALFGVYSPVLESRLVSVKLRYVIAALVVVLAAGWGVTLTRAIIAIRQGG
jgi:hypothetical protein